MKRVVSVSLGSSKRNKSHEVEILGEQFSIERIGTDGDMKKFAEMFRELDGKVDALGVGGADIYVVVGSKRYTFREIAGLIANAKITPVVDGSGLKHTLERETIRTLQRNGTIDFKGKPVLLVSGVDRFGMAQALEEAGANVTYGDLPFGVGVNIPLRGYAKVKSFGSVILPVITLCPFQWFYPTGEKQEKRTPKYPKLFEEADVIAGDWHYIRRYAPDNMPGKTILTQTLRTADLDWLKTTGAAQAITTTPMMAGETFATNVMEGVLVALLGKKPGEITEQEYLDVLKRLDWQPNVIPLAGRNAVAAV
jgi:hypothetical protein